MIETLLELMGRFNFASQKQRCIPYIRISWCFDSLQSNVASPLVGHSPTQARALLVIFASLVHTIFFVIVGTGPRYPSLLIAYALVAFSRAFLTGVC